MYNESTAVYDLIYSKKDYRKEAEFIKNMILSRSPNCKKVLDVGCGSSEHHKYLKKFFSIDGVDINADFLELARKKNPEGNYFCHDMTDFNLQKKYDVVICLFSSIAYVKTTEKLLAALNCFNQHLEIGGLTIVEPWFTKENWQGGKLFMVTAENDDLKVCRMNQTSENGNISVLNFHYLVGSKKNGISIFEETHELCMFTVDEIMNEFKTAGFEADYSESGPSNRGVYFGIKKK